MSLPTKSLQCLGNRKFRVFFPTVAPWFQQYIYFRTSNNKTKGYNQRCLGRQISLPTEDENATMKLVYRPNYPSKVYGTQETVNACVSTV